MHDIFIRFSTKFGDFRQISVKVPKINQENPFSGSHNVAYEQTDGWTNTMKFYATHAQSPPNYENTNKEPR